MARRTWVVLGHTRPICHDDGASITNFGPVNVCANDRALRYSLQRYLHVQIKNVVAAVEVFHGDERATRIANFGRACSIHRPKRVLPLPSKKKRAFKVCHECFLGQIAFRRGRETWPSAYLLEARRLESRIFLDVAISVLSLKRTIPTEDRSIYASFTPFIF